MANELIERNREIGHRFDDFLLRGGDPSTLFSSDFVYYDEQGNAHDLADTMTLDSRFWLPFQIARSSE